HPGGRARAGGVQLQHNHRRADDAEERAARCCTRGKLGAQAWRESVRTMLLLMAPITPHIAEELWARIGEPYSIHQQSFPTFDAAKAAEEETTLVVMRNGKPVDRVNVPVELSEADAKRIALESAAIQKALNGMEPKKIIFIPGRAAGGAPVEPKVNVVL
ncbi:MAG: class I tRNA ligase family protein, partial [Blastochloris sp.]|nr:class I tRNA ligase family protein [Blastochloris sp.]